MNINSVQSGYGAMELRERQKAAQLESQSQQDPFLIKDTATFSTEAMNLARTVDKQTGDEGGSIAPEDDSAASGSKGENNRKSLIDLLLDSIFMFTFEEEKAKPSTSVSSGDESGEEAVDSSLTETEGQDVRKMMDDMMTGNVDITELPEALLAMSSGKATGFGRTSGSGRKN